MLSLGILSIILMVVDHNSDWLDKIRASTSVALMPIITIADLPSRFSTNLDSLMTTREEMQVEIQQLRRQLLNDKANLIKMRTLEAENATLRESLGSTGQLKDEVLITELIGVNPDPDKHEIIVDKGTEDGVFKFQSVIDARGLIGQVIEAGPYTSRILLISDQRHSVPVQVTRSNLRLIAEGTGKINELKVLHVQDTADIQIGDLLVSSGLGGRFPQGYPVGQVTSMKHDPGQPFAEVKAKPSALLDRSRHVLLIFSKEKEKAPALGENG